MGWIYAFLALIAYVLVGVIAASPLIAMFDLSSEEGLGLFLVWTWPFWTALVGVIALGAWSLVAFFTGAQTPFARLAAIRASWNKQREQNLARNSHPDRETPQAEATRLAEQQARMIDWRKQRAAEQIAEASRAKARYEMAARGTRVGARVPRDADDFESVCAEWLRSCGVTASRTPKGPDGGLDVVGPKYAAQCKFHPSNKVGAPEIQQLAGAAAQARKTDIGFFHYGPGYTDAAVTAARQLGITLWVFDADRVQFRRV